MEYNNRRGRNYRRNCATESDQVKNCNRESNQAPENAQRTKNHNHEFLSSTDYAKGDECLEHNHRIAGVTGPAIRYGSSHIHKIETLTDTFDDHFHEICDTTGPAIYISGGKHIHLVCGETTCNDGHDHDYYFTTLIEDPSNTPNNR